MSDVFCRAASESLFHHITVSHDEPPTMMIRVVAIVFALAAAAANAWVLPKDVLQKAAAAGAVSAALLTAPLVSHAAQFDGSYSGAS